jgi:hypothetical protein
MCVRLDFFQELHLCVDGKVWKWSEPFDINVVGSVVRVMKSFNQQQSLIITVKQISNVQKQVNYRYLTYRNR